MRRMEDVICALATPSGQGAIGVIRVSGKGAKHIVSEIFSKNIADKKSHTLHFGIIKEKDQIIDEVLVSIFDEGKSFTGEESVEIACHGSKFILEKVISLLLDKGCRLAEPGEFTQRAFLNGKMDLSQAEAVADVIASESQAAHGVAIQQMRGGFSSELKELREKLIHFASLVELELDFSEEDVEFADRKELKTLVEEVIDYLNDLIRSFELGNAIKKGIPVVIAGRPNAGKSTLLNALLNEERAIVSEIAGTTRDTIEEKITINGIDFRFIDTAGIREATDEIEKIGVERALEQIERSGIYIYLFDASEMTASQLEEELQKLPKNKKRIIVANKSDLLTADKKQALKDFSPVYISAKHKKGLEGLKEELLKEIDLGRLYSGNTIITNARHKGALSRTVEALQKAKEGMEMNVTGDFLAMDIRQAMYELGTITGHISEEDLLDNIFSRFCIGK